MFHKETLKLTAGIHHRQKVVLIHIKTYIHQLEIFFGYYASKRAMPEPDRPAAVYPGT